MSRRYRQHGNVACPTAAARQHRSVALPDLPVLFRTRGGPAGHLDLCEAVLTILDTVLTRCRDPLAVQRALPALCCLVEHQDAPHGAQTPPAVVQRSAAISCAPRSCDDCDEKKPVANASFDRPPGLPSPCRGKARKSVVIAAATQVCLADHRSPRSTMSTRDVVCSASRHAEACPWAAGRAGSAGAMSGASSPVQRAPEIGQSARRGPISRHEKGFPAPSCEGNPFGNHRPGVSARQQWVTSCRA